MNDAEHRRNVKIAAMKDPELLDALLKDPDVTEHERVSFLDMQAQLRRGYGQGSRFLSVKQRTWAEEVLRRITPVDAKDVPRGKEVPTPAVLQNLPKAPPRRIIR